MKNRVKGTLTTIKKLIFDPEYMMDSLGFWLAFTTIKFMAIVLLIMYFFGYDLIFRCSCIAQPIEVTGTVGM